MSLGSALETTEEEPRPQKASDLFSEPMITAVRKISNEILLAAIVFGFIMATVAILGRFTFELGFFVLAVFYAAVLVYVVIRGRTLPSGLPPGQVTKTSQLADHVFLTFPNEIELPDPLVATDHQPELEVLSFKIPFSVASDRPLYTYLTIRSQFQSIVFLTDLVTKKWSWKSRRREEIPTWLNDARLARTTGNKTKIELVFNGRYRLMFAITDTAIRKQLPLMYRLWASYDGATWQDVSGPRTIYVTIVSDGSKVREMLGLAQPPTQ